MSTSDWQLVLGFEIHCELSTNSKMFCGCPADHFGKSPNTQTCPVCLGLPGALPVPNARAVEWCIKLGLALNCQINLFSKFDRKNYFYPDLPKGYQISQYDLPFCHSGFVTLSSGKKIRITRVHMEEDTAKLQHGEVSGQKATLIDFNRSGVPLVEIVTEPDFSDTEEATEFLKEVQLIIRTLGISSADMEKGSMRLEANISVRKAGDTQLPKFKVEVKNVNSFRFVRKAIEYEQKRQSAVLESGQVPVQETRGFDEAKGITFSQRIKENANDYRYFPEPDIPPLQFTADTISLWKSQLPQLPDAARAELVAAGVTSAKAALLVSDPQKLRVLRELVSMGSEVALAGDLVLNAPSDISADAQKVIAWSKSKQAIEINDEALAKAIASVLAQNSKSVADYKAGKEAALFYLVGQTKRLVGNVSVDVLKPKLIASIDSL